MSDLIHNLRKKAHQLCEFDRTRHRGRTRKPSDYLEWRAADEIESLRNDNHVLKRDYNQLITRSQEDIERLQREVERLKSKDTMLEREIDKRDRAISELTEEVELLRRVSWD